ncbi:unnamed protein product, partial [Rotaria sp. Silwood1]
MSTNQTSATSSPTSSGMARSNKNVKQRLILIRRDKITTASVLTISDEERNSNDLARKREAHRKVEEDRLAREKKLFTELLMLITNRSDSKSKKL